MPTLTYALEPNAPKRLEISWGWFWKNFTIRLDGQEVGRLAGQKELQQGQEFHLPDGSQLSVRLRGGLFSELHVLRDGQPLPGSASDPGVRLRNAYLALYFIGGLNLLFGLLAEIFQASFLLELGVGLYSMVLGVAFLGLGFLVMRRSFIALVIAFALLLVETLSRLLVGFSPGLLLNVIFLVILWQGMDALRAMGWRGVRR